MILFTHLLESTLFAGAAWLATLTLRRHRAGTRHALWMAASVKFLIPFALLVSLGSHVAPRDSASLPPPQMRFVMEDPASPPPFSAVDRPAAPVRRDWRPPLLWSLWLGGCVSILIRWYARWRDAVIRVRTSAIKEPGVFGVFSPVLLLPKGIEERLSAAQLEAVIAHEMCHIRRRDNLAAAIHMLVEALFWFHPLVWWMGARLVEERERACDEEVLELGNDPAVYAESILRVCQFCLESPVPCVSGITGAELKSRIRDIMAGRAGRRLGLGKKLILAALGLAAVAVPLAIGLAHPPQTLAQTAASLRFDVASVKVSSQPYLAIAPNRSGGRISWTTDLWYVLGYAYRLQPWRISGPVPGSSSIYEFNAVTSPDATDDEVRLMFQSLLIDRFRMAVHRETKEVTGYALTLAKNGHNMLEAKEGEVPALPSWMRGADPAAVDGKVVSKSGGAPGVVGIAGRRVTMQQFSEALQRQLGTAVLDRTGLTGKYYFALRYAQDDGPVAGDLPPLVEAVNELGLKLEKQKGPVEMLVVDRIEKIPTEN